MQSWIQFSRSLLRRRNFVGVLVATFSLGVAFSFVAPFMSLWGTQEVGFSPRELSAFMTAVTLSGIVVSTTLARWSDTHLSRRTTLLMGSTAGLLGYLGYALLHDRAALFAVGMTCIALSTVCFSQLFAHVREAFATEREDDGEATLIMSIVRVCFSVAWTAGPAIAALALVRFGYTGLFLTAACLYAAFLVGVIRFIPRVPRVRSIATRQRQPVWRALGRGDILACFLAFACVFSAHALNMMNLPLLLTNVLKATPRELGLAFCIGPIAEIPLMLWFGQLAAKHGRLWLIRIGVVATALYFVALLGAREPWHVYPIQILSGMSFAILTNVAITFFQDLLPGQAGLATTIFANSSSTGNLAGYFFFGTLVLRHGQSGVLIVCACLCAAAFALLLLYRPRQR